MVGDVIYEVIDVRYLFGRLLHFLKFAEVLIGTPTYFIKSGEVCFRPAEQVLKPASVRIWYVCGFGMDWAVYVIHEVGSGIYVVGYVIYEVS